jgi:hypothetical protein
VAVLDLLASLGVKQIDHGSIEFECCRNQDVLSAPLRGDRCGHEIVSGFRPVAFDVASASRKVRPKIGEYLTQTRHGMFGQIQCAESLVDVIEAVTEPVQTPRCEAKRVCVIADSPERALSGAFAHA